MEKYNDLIKHEATKLRIKHRMNELSEMECEDFVRGLLRQALIIDNVSKSLIHVCKFEKQDYPTKICKCKCGKASY